MVQFDSEMVIQQALVELATGIRINEKSINNILFAEDTVLLTERIDDMQRLIDKIMEISERLKNIRKRILKVQCE